MLLAYWVKFISLVHRIWRDPGKRAALFAAILAAAGMFLLQGPPYFTTASRPQRFEGNPGLEVQFLQDREDLRLTLGEVPSIDRETMRVKLHADFVFIAGYAGLFASLGVLVARRGGWKRLTGYTAAVLGIAAGGFDIAENRATFRILNVPIPQTTESMLNAIYWPASVKWSLSTIALLALMTYFIPSRKLDRPPNP